MNGAAGRPPPCPVSSPDHLGEGDRLGVDGQPVRLELGVVEHVAHHARQAVGARFVEVVPLEELPDDAMVVTAAMMGAPTVMIEKLPSLDG